MNTQTITVYGKKHTCEIINGCVQVNGQPIMIAYRQGYSGSKVYEDKLNEWQCNVKSDGSLTIKAYWVNSSRQVKDPNAYLLGAKVINP